MTSSLVRPHTPQPDMLFRRSRIDGPVLRNVCRADRNGKPCNLPIQRRPEQFQWEHGGQMRPAPFQKGWKL